MGKGEDRGGRRGSGRGEGGGHERGKGGWIVGLLERSGTESVEADVFAGVNDGEFAG